MASGGVYSLATAGAKDVIDLATPRVLQALESITPELRGHWSFSDMGCADGGTSLDLWRAVVTHCRSRSDNDIQIVYADQARNDFNALVQILHGLTQFDSYVSEFDRVNVLESGSSFYNSILPADSLDLGFSATAMHWLSCKPCDISDHIHMVGATGSELASFEEQARKDWNTILLRRARELKPGGRLVLVNFCRDPAGRYLGATGGLNMFENFNRNWQSFVDDGVITMEEYIAMTLPQYYNTVEEFSAPLVDESSAVWAAGLRLENIETQVVPCPFAEAFKQHGDAVRFAREYIPTIRSWNESIFAGALSDSRPAQERHEIIESYYTLYQQQAEQSPETARYGLCPCLHDNQQKIVNSVPEPAGSQESASSLIGCSVSN